MKIEELRIGNFVYDTKGNVNTVCVETFEKFNYQIKPITLTEEWLFEFGFEKEQGEATGIAIWDEFYFNSFHIGNHGIGLFPFHYTNDGSVTVLEYVHQLQNLYFAITSEELKLKKND